jgi:hypothetical protein
MLENFNEDINEIEVMSLFRESTIIGNGKVDFDSFLLCANENNFFCRHLSIAGINPKPKITFLGYFDTTSTEGRVYQ